MKIYFISKDAGWQKYRLEVLSCLANTYSYNIEILTTGKVKEYIKNNGIIFYKIFNSLLPQSFRVSFFPGAIWHIIRKRPDVVLALNNTTQFTEYLALIVCRILKIKFVWWTHAYDHKAIKNNFVKSLKERYALFFLKKSNTIITFSDKGKEYLIDKGINGNKIFVAKNTIDTDKILLLQKNLKLDKSKLKKQFGYKETDRILIFTGRLNKEKKVSHAIRACNQLKAELPQLKLVIVGAGEDLIYLKNLVMELGATNVQFLGEIYDEELLAKWFTISDLYIMPAYVGLGIIHAFCYGLPIITEFDENHGPEIQYLKNGVNGYMVEKDNIQALISIIRDIIMDEPTMNSLSTHALETIKNEADIKTMVSNMNKALSI